MNQLIPQNILQTLPDLYATSGDLDPICHVKLFTPDSNWTWYVIEFSQDNNDTLYTYVQGLENELGYSSLSEIESVRGSLNLPVERDLSFKPTPLSQIKKVV